MAYLFTAFSASAKDVAGVPVVMAEAKQVDIVQEIQLTGKVTSPQTAKLSVATEGLITEVTVDRGGRVDKGKPLLFLDSELARLRLNSALAKKQQSTKSLLDAQRRLKEARVLIPQRSISESAVRDLEAEVEIDKAALQQVEADARYYQALVDRHQLMAPFTGVISNKNVAVGEWISPGQTAFELVALKDLRLEFEIAEDYLSLINSNTRVFYTLDALNTSKPFESFISAVVPVIDGRAQTFHARATVRNDHPHIQPGMSVSATLQVPTGRKGVAVPRDAILRYPDGRIIVWSIDNASKPAKAVENVVRTGEKFQGLVEIISGINKAAKVVVRGNEALQSGQIVRIVD